MKNKTTLKTLAAICVLALLIGVLPAMAFAEEMVEIPESDYLYVNGESKVVTVDGELSALLRLVVEDPGKFHILSSGVDITLVLYDEVADEVRDVYASQNGLMDVPFYAAPGMYLLGISGFGEAEILVADEESTAQIYAGEEPVDQPAEVPAEEVEAQPAEEVAEAPAEEAPAYDPSAPVVYKAELNETVSVLSVLEGAGASVDAALTWASGDMEGRVFSAAGIEGDWLLTPYAYFDSIDITVKAGEEAEYNLVLSCPDPEQEEEPAEEAEDEGSEEATEETDEAVAEAAPAAEVTIAMERFAGNEIRLFAEGEAEEDENLVYQWQLSMDGEHWTNVEGANSREYTFTLDETNCNSYWRLIVSE